MMGLGPAGEDSGEFPRYFSSTPPVLTHQFLSVLSGLQKGPLAQGFPPFSLKPGLCFLPTYHFTTHSYSKHLQLLFSVVNPTAMTLYRSVLV